MTSDARRATSKVARRSDPKRSAKEKTDPSEFEKLLGTLPSDADLYFIPLRGKFPAVPKGESWKDPKYRLSKEQVRRRLQKGKNYGLVFHGQLVGMDIDQPDKAEEILDLEKLPPAIGGRSRNGKPHLIWRQGGDVANKDYKDENDEKVIEIKADWKYLVGPGSYVPPDPGASGDGVYRVTKTCDPGALKLEHLPKELQPDTREVPKVEGARSSHGVKIGDVVDLNKLTEREGAWQGPHPVHGSKTGRNFSVDPEQNVWFCHRHDCGGGPFELIAVMEDIVKCGEWSRGETPLKGKGWIETVEAARQRGLISAEKAEELTTKGESVSLELPEEEYKQLAQELAGGDVTDKMLSVFKKTVKEDDRTLELGLYHMLSAYTPDPINLGLEAPTSEGKTYPIVEVAKRFPPEDVWFLGGLSPTALVHDYGKRVDKTTNEPLAPRLAKLEARFDGAKKGEKGKIKREIGKLMRRSKWEINLEGKIIVFLEAPSPETFARLRPILSHDVSEITYKFTDKRGQSLRQVTTTIKGWPVAVFFKAVRGKQDSIIWDQIESRFTTISPKMNADKYRAAVMLMAKRKGLPAQVFERKVGLDDFERAKGIIRAVKRRLLEITEKVREKSRVNPPNIFWIPFFGEIGNGFPASVGRHMRDSQRFLTAMQMSAALNVFSRPTLEIGGAEYIVVTRQDYERALNLYFKEGAETIFTGIPGHIAEFFKKVAVPLWDEKEAQPTQPAGQQKIDGDSEEILVPVGVTRAEMVNKYREVFGKGISSKTLWNRYLPALENVGVLSSEPDPGDKRRYLYQVQEREISPIDTPLYSLFGKGSSFTRQTLEQRLEELNQIVPPKLLVNKKEISADQLWENYYSENECGGINSNLLNRPDNGGGSKENPPEPKKGAKGTNTVSQREEFEEVEVNCEICEQKYGRQCRATHTVKRSRLLPLYLCDKCYEGGEF